VVRGRLIAVLAGTAALVAAPPCALAQNGRGAERAHVIARGGSPGAFPDYRQAAADQYPQQPPPGNSGSSGPPSGQPGAGNGHNGGHNGSGGNAGHQGHGGSGSHNHGGVLGSSSHGSRAPVAVPARPVPAATGSLPFTGSDLSGLVVLALILIAAGLFAGAAARATRRRRRRVPA
jgi:hypothetical protein